jgi:hypothetical protein
MRGIARTSRNTGITTGALGLVVLAIGGPIAVALAAVVVFAEWIASGAMLVAGGDRRRRAARHVL